MLKHDARPAIDDDDDVARRAVQGQSPYGTARGGFHIMTAM